MSIIDILTSNPDFNKAIDDLKNNKPYKKILSKACEELSELTTELLKKINNPDKVVDIKIAKELVDVQINITLLEKIIPGNIISEATDHQVNKFLNSRGRKKYKSE